MNENENKQAQDIEVIVGDDSILNISEVGDCMNDLRPKTSEKKQVIIPKTKKKEDDKNKEKEDSENKE